VTRGVLNHERVRHLGGGRYEFIEPEHGETDFRVVGSGGFHSESLTQEAAKELAARFTRSRCTGGPSFWVQSRIVGVTDWEDEA
jgi:hypothetical protein